ncbi:MAG: hypothetical protein H0V89_05625 [Deltaproteobacteria bacterium]|nr:hypothetical protein [Deltaproteobacteria bacterium]
MLALLAAAALGAPTVAECTASWGTPTQTAEVAQRTRSENEPLLVYWMQTQAAPLGVGPLLPGTLVANFAAAASLPESQLRDFTFLAMATPEQIAELEKALKKAKISGAVTRETRAGGTFRDVPLAMPDGSVGTLSIREAAATGKMADGRPSPSLWMHVGPPGA